MQFNRFEQLFFRTEPPIHRFYFGTLLNFNFKQSSYYSEYGMLASVCIKIVLYNQKWIKLLLRISSETSFFSQQHKLSSLVDMGLHFHKDTNLDFPFVLFSSSCLHRWSWFKRFVTLPRLHATAVKCAHELINGETGVNGEAGKILQN